MNPAQIRKFFHIMDVKQYYCGIGPCHPKTLQWFASAKFFTFILSLNGLIEGALVSGRSS